MSESASQSVSQSVSQTKHDLEIFEWIMAMPMVHTSLKKVRDRHCMHKVSNKQFQGGLASMNGQYGPKLFEVASDHCRGLTSSQICEDVIGHQKNGSSTCAPKRFRRPELSMYKALNGEVINARHSYRTPSMELPLSTSGAVLPKEAFAVRSDLCTMKDELKTMAGFSSQAPFFSPQAVNNGVSTADLPMLREVYRLKDPLLVSDFVFHNFFQVRHHIAWRYIGTNVWYKTCSMYPSSSMLVCPLSLITKVGPNWHYFVHEKIAKMEMKVILDHKRVEAVSYTWRGPSWLICALGRNLSSRDFGLVMEKMDAPMPVFKLACTKAFLLLLVSFIITANIILILIMLMSWVLLVLLLMW